MKNIIRWLKSTKLKLTIRDRPITVSLLAILLATFCGIPICISSINSFLRKDIGILPTYTPSNTPTITLTPSFTMTLSPSITTSPTVTPSPTLTQTATPTPIQGPFVIIEAKDKVAEYVDIKNIGNQEQNLQGWKLVSERGNQTCWLSGVLGPGVTLRIWADNAESGGFNCRMGTTIWNNDEPDPAVLYNAQGQEVDRR